MGVVKNVKDSIEKHFVQEGGGKIAPATRA